MKSSSTFELLGFFTCKRANKQDGVDGIANESIAYCFHHQKLYNASNVLFNFQKTNGNSL